MDRIFTTKYAQPEIIISDDYRVPNFHDNPLLYAPTIHSQVGDTPIAKQVYPTDDYTLGLYKATNAKGFSFETTLHKPSIFFIGMYDGGLQFTLDNYISGKLIGPRIFPFYSSTGSCQIDALTDEVNLLCIILDIEWLIKNKHKFPLLQPLIQNLIEGNRGYEILPPTKHMRNKKAIFNDMHTCTIENKIRRDYALETFINQLLFASLDHIEAGYPDAFKLQQHLKQNFLNPEMCKIEKLMDVVSKSESGLYSVFVNAFGIPTSTYTLQLKMRMARNLLITTGISVGAAGKAVGYDDIYEFSRAFKRHFGYSPTKIPLHLYL